MAHKSRYGAGSIRKRDEGRWELRVLAGRDPVSGKHRYVSRSVRGTKREAEAVMAALLVEVSQGGGRQGTDATMGHLIEQWLDLRKDSLSVTTYEGYVGKVRFRILPALGDVAVRKLTVRDIDAFYRAMSRDAGLAPSTVKQMHNVLVGSLDQAVRWQWRPDNPARQATLPQARPSDVRPPSPADVLSAIAAADLEFATFVRVSASVGGRRGEVSALRWSNIDLNAGEVVISKALVERSADRAILEKDTKSHQNRRVALDAGTVDALRSWRASMERRAEIGLVTLTPTAYVFSPSLDGTLPWRPFHWTAAWRRLRAKTGIDEKVRLHDLRHFTATFLLDAGVPVKTVSTRLGHARPATTLNVYAQFVPVSDRLAADAMAGILSPPPPPALPAD
ncbi:MAG: tyrosine-type recombinase/integrase [Acidimicrobiales bacterium]